MALALAAFARRRWGDPAGLLAGLIAVTSIGFQVIGRASTADGCLNFLLVLAGLDAWRFAESQSRAALRRAYGWVALGLLVKGPVALVVPGAAFFLWCATSRRWALLGAALRDVWGWVLLVAIAAPWYAYELHRDGMAFVNGFLMKHNVDRFTGTIGGHAGTPLYYLVMLPLLAMPWAPALVGVVARARSLWREPVARYLLGWGGFVIVFFSLSATKLPHYVLYGYAPLVLLMARAIAQAGRKLRIALACSLVAWAAIVAAVPWIVMRMAPSVRDPLYHALLAGAAAPVWWPALLVAVLVIALLAWPARSDTAWLRVSGAAGALALLVASWSLPWFGETLQGPIRRAAAVATAHGGDVAQWRAHWPSFSVYFQRETPVRDPLPNEMALTRADRMPPEGQSRPRLFEERGIVLLGPSP
jgi:4-amino-4-deoxy-L-arabinose transferase-like glycosyltransferase